MTLAISKISAESNFRLRCYRTPILRGVCFLVGIEGAQSPPPPTCELIGLAYLLGFILLQPVYKFKEGAEQGSPVIVHQLDQPGLLD